MPLFPTRTLEALTTLANDAGTYTLKLPKQGALQWLNVKLQWTNGATSALNVYPWDAFDDIQVLANGTQQILSMTVRELYFWNWAMFGRQPAGKLTMEAGGVQYIDLIVPFGLPLGNTQHFLPLKRFQNLELRVTYSPTISATAGFATGTGKVAVYACISMDDNDASFAGFLRNRTINTFTSAASGNTRVDVVGPYPILALMGYVYEAGTGVVGNISNVALQLSDGAITYIDRPTNEIALANMLELGIDGEFGQVVMGGNTDTVNLVAAPFFPPSVNSLQAAPTIGTTTIGHFRIVSVAGDQGTLSAFNDTADGAATAQVAYTTDTALNVVGKLQQFPRGFLLPFGFPDKLDRLLMPSAYDKVWIDLTNANAGADVRISQLDIAQAAA